MWEDDVSVTPSDLTDPNVSPVSRSGKVQRINVQLLSFRLDYSLRKGPVNKNLSVNPLSLI